MKQTETNQTDSMVVRNRAERTLFAVAGPLLSLAFGLLLGLSAGAWFALPSVVGTAVGLALGTVMALWVFMRSYVINNAVSAFVTVDLVSKDLVTYGPGFHFCYPWEKRSGSNNVDLGEAAESFSLTVQVDGGTAELKYSVRLRPDIRLLPEFLSGVASIASEIGGLISTEIISFADKKSLVEMLKSVKDLNKHLRDIFVNGTQNDGTSDFEKRFGVIIGDVTVEEILPSKEVQETASAITEARMVDEIVATSFGYDDVKSLQKAVVDGVVPQNEVNRRRTQTMALSGNLQGMDLKEQTFRLDVSGLDAIDPKFAEALAMGLSAFANRTNKAKTKGAT